jgi:hypothetical protein
VGSVERVSDVDGKGKKNFRFQRMPCHAMLQGQPLKKLHGDERLPLLLASVVNRAEVEVVQRLCGLGFALKARECPWVEGNRLGQKLQGDETMQSHVFGFVDHVHPAATELLNDTVMRDGLADHAQGCYGGSAPKSMKAEEFVAGR